MDSYSGKNFIGLYKAKTFNKQTDGLIPLREILLFSVPKIDNGGEILDGRLAWNAPRVDFTSSKFCLDCHSTSEKLNALKLSALKENKFERCEYQDRRRQPMQGAKAVYGVIPSTDSGFWNSIALTPNHQIYIQRGNRLLMDSLILLSKPGTDCSP